MSFVKKEGGGGAKPTKYYWKFALKGSAVYRYLEVTWLSRKRWCQIHKSSIVLDTILYIWEDEAPLLSDDNNNVSVFPSSPKNRWNNVWKAFTMNISGERAWDIIIHTLHPIYFNPSKSPDVPVLGHWTNAWSLSSYVLFLRIVDSWTKLKRILIKEGGSRSLVVV
jgi:hypothetical protein